MSSQTGTQIETADGRHYWLIRPAAATDSRGGWYTVRCRHNHGATRTQDGERYASEFAAELAAKRARDAHDAMA